MPEKRSYIRAIEFFGLRKFGSDDHNVGDTAHRLRNMRGNAPHEIDLATDIRNFMSGTRK
jgi:hypothetical protein